MAHMIYFGLGVLSIWALWVSDIWVLGPSGNYADTGMHAIVCTCKYIHIYTSGHNVCTVGASVRIHTKHVYASPHRHNLAIVLLGHSRLASSFLGADIGPLDELLEKGCAA